METEHAILGLGIAIDIFLNLWILSRYFVIRVKKTIEIDESKDSI